MTKINRLKEKITYLERKIADPSCYLPGFFDWFPGIRRSTDKTRLEILKLDLCAAERKSHV